MSMRLWWRPLFLMAGLGMLAASACAGSEWKAFSTPGGQPPPALQLADLAGNAVDLSALKGEVVLVNFWATWCEPCRDEMPSLNRLARRMADRNLVVLTVDVGEAPERIRRFLTQAGIELPVLLDRDSSTSRAWQARGYPTSYVVGPDGRIRYYYVGALDWTSERVTRVLERMR